MTVKGEAVMFEVRGKYNTAKIFTDTADQDSIAQVISLLNQPFAAGSRIRMMPDIHAGKGCTIGTTMTITDKIVPNLVGVDIGCGMETAILKERHIELQKLDKVIREHVPAGFAKRDKKHRFRQNTNLEKLRCLKHINLPVAEASLGTLGGGNHFIEADKDAEGNIYLVVHSGSRYLGLEMANYYQKLAWETMDEQKIPKDLAYLSSSLLDDYIHDMRIVQEFALWNRKAILDEIIKGMHLHIEESFSTIHNYIDTEHMILRKGSVSAQQGEKLIIPINMRDGCLICVGKGNPDWNYSAPHGAGRLMSRSEAKESFTVSEFKKQMQGIYTTSVGQGTLDECPMAYKTMDEIVQHIDATAEIISIIKPVYNFKAGAFADD
jgi:RNA-splicing ligase RtcB